MADKKRIINKEKEIDADIDVVKRMSTKLGCYCIRKMIEEKMTMTEVMSTITMMSCLMIDSLASSTGRDPRYLLDGYVELVKVYKVQGEGKEN